MNPVGDHRELDAALRAASREEPPPALDAAIAAAARRAVGSAPRRAHPSRTWWPVAAAATVAAVAIGIVEMTPPEQVAPTAMAPAPRPNSTPGQGGASEQPAPAAPEPAPAQNPAAPSKRRDVAATPPARQAKADERGAAQGAQAAADVAGRTRERDAGEERPSEATPKVERASPAAGIDAAVSSSKPRAVPALPNPFPTLPADASTSAGVTTAPPADRFAAPSVANALKPAPTANALAGAPSAQDAHKPASPLAAGALAAREEPMQSNAPAALAKLGQESAAQRATPERQTVDDWIRLIRRLKAEGRNDIAAKELAAFRALYKERADALLPADLRGEKLLR